MDLLIEAADTSVEISLWTPAESSIDIPRSFYVNAAYT